jgi:hypothetical protein
MFTFKAMYFPRNFTIGRRIASSFKVGVSRTITEATPITIAKISNNET